ncbi:MAG TPA: alpha/beta hydrolase domain-containing protein [Methylomirabilota bacterium]|nr:alpha/beta hydrolase domain-containing protein [Methylomirabilota bacterium]
MAAFVRRSIAPMVAGLLAALGAAAPAEARIVAVRIDRTEPFAAGASFGAAGAYERVVGVARGEVDPRDPANAGIVNLARAPRNARDLVEYETDFYLLRPADPARGNRKIVYEVNNRGRKLLFLFFMDAPAGSNDPRSAAEVGNAFLLRQGYTLAWSGWDPDAPRTGGGLAMQAPVPSDGGRPIVRTIREELVSGTRGQPVEIFRLSYEAATLDQSAARLTVRRNEAHPPSEVPAGEWAYVDGRSIRLLPAGTRPGPGTIYDFRYPARDPKVLGLGFAATRDFVAFLRHAPDGATAPNPARGGTRAVLAVGVSQSGRYLRDHIGQGFNRDEAGRRVFDGVLAHISGVGRVFLNAEFGQPGRTNTQHEDHLMPENEFPFSSARLTDPVTGRSGALLRGDGSDPRLIEVNTSTEYWQKGASLLHTDPLGRRDVPLPAGTRAYLVAGTQHGGRAGLTAAPGPCANPRNPHSPAPALRALLTALDRWVSDGVEPPPSRVPTLAGRTLVPPDDTGFPSIPGVRRVLEVNRLVLFGDWTAPRPEPAKAYRPLVYRPLVSRVDGDGNEVAGIRLPAIAVPLGTHTGWNVYRDPFPDGELCDRDGTFAAFARTRADRLAAGDPRPSLEERYGSHDAYVARVEVVTAALVGARLLLAEDADRIRDAARRANPMAP